MTQMKAKDYLMQCRIIDREIRELDAMISGIREELVGFGFSVVKSAWPDGQPHGTGTTDPTAVNAAKAADMLTEERRQELRKELMDLETKALRRRSDLWSKRAELIDVIGEVQNPIQAEILYLRYLHGKSWEQIAVEIGYSWRHTVRIHGDALQAVEKIMAKK